MISLNLTDAIGLIGVALYVIAHFSVQVLHKSATGRLAVTLNVIGPICILVSLYGAFNLPSFLSQVFWLVLTLVGWWCRRPGRLLRQGTEETASERCVTRAGGTGIAAVSMTAPAPERDGPVALRRQ